MQINKYSSYHKNFTDFAGFVEFCKSNNIKSSRVFKKLGSNRPHNIPSTPHRTYKQEWKGWSHITGNALGGKRDFVIFQEFVDFCQKHNVKSLKHFKTIQRPIDIPSNPQLVYKKEWMGWAYVTHSGGKTRWLPFKEARAYMHTQDLVSRTHASRGWLQWEKSGKRPHNIPSNPYTSYRKEWTNWYDFLGTKWVKYPKAKIYAIASQIKLKKDWSKKGMDKYGILKPGNIPLSINRIYANQWQGAKSFLGTKAVPYKIFINFLIENNIKTSRQLADYLKATPQKGIKSRPDYYYKQWPGWVKFRKLVLA